MFTLSLLDPLYVALSWVLRHFYNFFNDYAVSVIVFTILIRALLIPFSVKQHKNTLRMQALTPQIDDLKRIYGKDRQGFQQAQMELYKQHKISQTGGCLTSSLSLLVIWPIYRLVSAPLHWITGAAREGIEKTANYLVEMGQLAPSHVKTLQTMDLPVVDALNAHPSSFAHAVDQGWLQAGNHLDLTFFGANIGMRPSLNPKDIFGPQMADYLPLLVIVILAVLTTFLTSKVMEWTSPNRKKMQEAREAAKRNPARTEPTEPTQGMMKGMKYTMPLFTGFISITMPAAMGLYWISSNLMGVVQQLILYALYTRKHQNSTKDL